MTKKTQALLLCQILACEVCPKFFPAAVGKSVPFLFFLLAFAFDIVRANQKHIKNVAILTCPQHCLRQSGKEETSIIVANKI